MDQQQQQEGLPSPAATSPKAAASPAEPDRASPTGLIYHYLQEQNKPFSAADVAANIQTHAQAAGVKVSKLTATKALKELHEQALIEARVSGKQVVYHAKQDADDPAHSPAALAALAEEIAAAQAECVDLRAREKKLRARIGAAQQAARQREQNSPGALRQLVAARRAELDQVRAELREAGVGEGPGGGPDGAAPAADGVAEGGQGRVGEREAEREEADESPTALARLDMELRRWRGHASRRRRIAREMWETIEEAVSNGGGNVKELKEMFDID